MTRAKPAYHTLKAIPLSWVRQSVYYIGWALQGVHWYAGKGSMRRFLNLANQDGVSKYLRNNNLQFPIK